MHISDEAFDELADFSFNNLEPLLGAVAISSTAELERLRPILVNYLAAAIDLHSGYTLAKDAILVAFGLLDHEKPADAKELLLELIQYEAETANPYELMTPAHIDLIHNGPQGNPPATEA